MTRELTTWEYNNIFIPSLLHNMSNGININYDEFVKELDKRSNK